MAGTDAPVSRLGFSSAGHSRAHSRRCWTPQVEPLRRGYRAAIILLTFHHPKASLVLLGS
jgi:hypothetical protein